MLELGQRLAVCGQSQHNNNTEEEDDDRVNEVMHGNHECFEKSTE